jgi:carbon storage regulator
MLVLSRKSSEAVIIGCLGGAEPLMKVTVLEVRDGRVKLGFDVPDDMPVHREEVWARINGSNTPPVA